MFFPLGRREGVGEDGIFKNSCVPIIFSSVPNEVPQVSNSFLMMMFLKFSMCVPMGVPK